jgi:hypothetical protein
LSDKIKLQRALKRGEFYFSLDVLGNPKGFNVLLEDRDQLHLMGARVPWVKGMRFRVEVPAVSGKAKLLVYRDGDLVQQMAGVTTEFLVTKPGNYRFEVVLQVALPLPDQMRWIPWIYTNHFYIYPNKVRT